MLNSGGTLDKSYGPQLAKPIRKLRSLLIGWDDVGLLPPFSEDEILSSEPIETKASFSSCFFDGLYVLCCPRPRLRADIQSHPFNNVTTID